MKISYLIASIKPPGCVENVIKSISELPDHDYEIVLVSNHPIISPNLLFLNDEDKSSVKAFNRAYKNSRGELIVVLTDDHIIPKNFLNVLSYIQSDEFLNQKIKIANLCHWIGGPGKPLKYKTGEIPQEYKLNHVFENPENIKNLRPFHTIAFPMLLRESIENYLQGVLFNESFIHHHCDSWLGFYTEIINKKDVVGPSDVYFLPDHRCNSISSPNINDTYDKSKLIELIVQSSSNPNYNNRV